MKNNRMCYLLIFVISLLIIFSEVSYAQNYPAAPYTPESLRNLNSAANTCIINTSKPNYTASTEEELAKEYLMNDLKMARCIYKGAGYDFEKTLVQLASSLEGNPNFIDNPMLLNTSYYYTSNYLDKILITLKKYPHLQAEQFFAQNTSVAVNKIKSIINTKNSKEKEITEKRINKDLDTLFLFMPGKYISRRGQMLSIYNVTNDSITIDYASAKCQFKNILVPYKKSITSSPYLSNGIKIKGVYNNTQCKKQTDQDTRNFIGEEITIVNNYNKITSQCVFEINIDLDLATLKKPRSIYTVRTWIHSDCKEFCTENYNNVPIYYRKLVKQGNNYIKYPNMLDMDEMIIDSTNLHDFSNVISNSKYSTDTEAIRDMDKDQFQQMQQDYANSSYNNSNNNQTNQNNYDNNSNQSLYEKHSSKNKSYQTNTNNNNSINRSDKVIDSTNKGINILNRFLRRF